MIYSFFGRHPRHCSEDVMYLTRVFLLVRVLAGNRGDLSGLEL
jgi:hypothetical protein